MLRSIKPLLALLIICGTFSGCGYLEASKKRTKARQRTHNSKGPTLSQREKDDNLDVKESNGQSKNARSAKSNENFPIASINNPSSPSTHNFEDGLPSYERRDSVASFGDVQERPILDIQPAEIIGQKTDGPIFTIAPKFELTNQYGEKITQKSMQNGLTIVTFFFTRCPSICPKVSNNLSTLQQELADRGAFKILSISVDPMRDNVERLYQYSKNYEALPDRWNFLTGDTSTILNLYRKTFKLPFDDSMGEMAYQAHSSKVFLVRNQTEVLGFYDGTSSLEMEFLLEDALRFIQ